MKPYYDDGQISIYHGDCRDVMPNLESVEIVLTDPPYNAGKDYGGHNDSMDDDKFRQWLSEWWDILPSRRIVFPGLVKWKDYAALTPSTLGFWYKPGNPGGGGGYQWEEGEPLMAWGCNFGGSNVFRATVSKQKDVGDHPCPKPLPLIHEIIKRCRFDGVWLDPFVGSGTTLRAAKDLGCKAIGIEINERYCEIAANRLMQTVLPFAKDVVNAS